MSPTVFREGPFRFYFFSREEPRLHVHVICPEGEAKFWLVPLISLAQSHGMSKRQLLKVQQMVEDRQVEIRKAWKTHFGS